MTGVRQWSSLSGSASRRNSRWVEEISELMEGSGTALMVVGAAHLVGEDSVPTMLKKGYSVTRQ
ncbi:MAG: TraB/GumN family protein [Geminicoccaceae bacterium]